MNIFVLHAMGDFSQARKTSADHALCFRRYQPEHNYFYHDVNQPVPDAVRDFPFDGVILDTTALCIRYYRPRDLFYAERERYSFISDWDAVKVAFPQDDYDHSAILDRWLADLEVDLVYSVLGAHREVIYPQVLRQATVLNVLTGYVDDADVVRWGRQEERYRARPVDIGYRAKMLPAQFGRYGQIKGRIVHGVEESLRDQGLVLDLSTDPEQVFLGADWLRFLASCRYCLGSEGGSSVLDPEGEITDRVKWFCRENPHASFEEVATACLGEEDGRHVFSAVSPRLFEAALAGCGQILVRAPYLDSLCEYEHYLPIDEKASKVGELVPLIRDEGQRRAMVDACYETLIATERYRYSTHARRVIGDIAARLAARGLRPGGRRAFGRMMGRVRTREERRPVENRRLGVRRSGLTGLLKWLLSA